MSGQSFFIPRLLLLPMQLINRISLRLTGHSIQRPKGIILIGTMIETGGITQALFCIYDQTLTSKRKNQLLMFRVIEVDLNTLFLLQIIGSYPDLALDVFSSMLTSGLTRDPYKIARKSFNEMLIGCVIDGIRSGVPKGEYPASK